MTHHLHLGLLIGLGCMCLPGTAIGMPAQSRAPADTVPPKPPARRPPSSHPTPSGPPRSASPGALPSAGPAECNANRSLASSADSSNWRGWWGFNSASYFNLKSKVYSEARLVGSDTWFLGRGSREDARDSLPPSQKTIRERVVPALIKAIEEDRCSDLQAGALIALAKTGDVVGEDGRSELESVLRPCLRSGSQEVAERATLALGILASDGAVALLTQLAGDDAAIRRELGKSEVPYRMRAFAAYGLGLIAHGTSDNALRQEIAGVLLELLTSSQFSTRDIKVAALTAFGLTPVDPVPTPLLAPGRGGSIRQVASRETQIDFLLDYLDPDQAREHASTRHWFVRAHAPAALARLLDGAAPRYREKAAAMLLRLVERKTNAQREVVMSATLALGQIGDASDSGAGDIDRRIRRELLRLVREGAPQVRGFALISLAQAAGQPGRRVGPEAESADAGLAQATDELVRVLETGSTQLRPWAGLGLGVLAAQRDALDEPLPAKALDALHRAARACKSPERVGAYLLGMGIAGYGDGLQTCLDKVEFFSGSDEARGDAAIALGLMDERSAVPVIQELIRGGKCEPALIEQGVIALGLLGDRALVPELIRMLEEAKGTSTQAAVARALGSIGDSRSIDPLLAMLENQRVSDASRGFAAVALGIVCEKQVLPWNAKIARNINYRASTPTLTSTSGTGVLDIL